MKIGVGIVLTFLLCVMFASLFSVFSMNMVANQSGCPFMVHEEVVCPMSFTEHIEAWQSAFLAIAPTMYFFLLMVSAAALIAVVAPNILIGGAKYIPFRFNWSKESVYGFSLRAWQELFSRGILHPKLF